MIVQTITYIDYNGNERNEHRYFKLKTESEEQHEIQQEDDNQSN